MRHASRRQLGIGLAIALVATVMSGTTVLAFPAPVDTTTASGPDTILPPPIGGGSAQQPPYAPGNSGSYVLASLQSGLNVRIPTAESLLEYAIERNASAS